MEESKLGKGKVVILTPEERHAVLQALGTRRTYLEKLPENHPAVTKQLPYVRGLIDRIGYKEAE